MVKSAPRSSSLLALRSAPEARQVSAFLRSETLRGSLMVAVTVAAWVYEEPREAASGAVDLRQPRPPVPADCSTRKDRRARAEHSGRVLEGYRT